MTLHTTASFQMRKQFNEQSVLDAALERIRYCFDHFDRVCISFSGGKDSTAVLNLALVVAKEKGRLPLEVHFYDEEAIHPPTIEYVDRVRQIPEINMKWYCLEFKHRNACSEEEPWWYCWEKGKEDIWVRPMPNNPNVITFAPNFKKGMSIPDFAHDQPKELGTTCILTGIRTQESMRRYSAVSRKVNENYISYQSSRWVGLAHPIYDWSSQDVWKLVSEWGLDYNRTYDIFNKTKHYERFLTQRVGPPFGEEPLRGLWLYSECFPEMWHKMIGRVRGVATAFRYSNTELYGVRKDNEISKPSDMSWTEYMEAIVDRYSGKDLIAVKKMLSKAVKLHYGKTDDPIPDIEAHPLSGFSMSFLCMLALKGDFKGRSMPRATLESDKARAKLGITLDQAVEKYGNAQYKIAMKKMDERKAHIKSLIEKKQGK